MEPSLSDTIRMILHWADHRNLVLGSTRQAQMVKLTEEVGELAGGIAKNNHEKIVDSIGDALVVLAILASQSETTLSECAYKAYLEIKDRKGKMVDGIFVKEQDL